MPDEITNIFEFYKIITFHYYYYFIIKIDAKYETLLSSVGKQFYINIISC